MFIATPPSHERIFDFAGGTHHRRNTPLYINMGENFPFAMVFPRNVDFQIFPARR
jgi:hypothetical protein